MKRSKKKEPTRVGNIGFLFAIPSLYVLCFFSTLTLWTLPIRHLADSRAIALYLFGLIIGRAVMSEKSGSRIRTFLHESKHALVIVFTGGKLKEFRVGHGDGHVTYESTEEAVQFGPLIALAPYYLPLLTLPVLLASPFLEANESYRLGLCFALGATSSWDLFCAWQDFHPHQTDLTRLIGGRVCAALFVFAANYLWISLSFVWLIAGARGYERFLLTAVSLMKLIYAWLLSGH